MARNQEATEDWIGIVGRCLAFLCLHFAELRDKNLAVQSRFLQNLGLSMRDAARVLGTSENSLAVKLSRAKKGKKGVKKQSKKNRI